MSGLSIKTIFKTINTEPLNIAIVRALFGFNVNTIHPKHAIKEAAAMPPEPPTNGNIIIKTKQLIPAPIRSKKYRLLISFLNRVNSCPITSPARKKGSVIRR